MNRHFAYALPTPIAAALAALVVTSACTLDIDIPLEPPPERWDPALNTHPDGAAFAALLDRHVGEGVPGVVLLVQTPDGLWNGAAGFAKLETAQPMLPTHRFPVASVTKMYTAAAAMLVAEDGWLDLDARLSTLLPAAVHEPVPNGSDATVRQLLGHTSGIPDFSGSFAYDLDTINEPHGDFSAERLLSYLHGQSPIFSPGEGYFYSNANFLLVAMVLDRLGVGSHADLISERILTPLASTGSYYKNEPGYPSPPGLVNTYVDLTGDGRLTNVSDLTVHSLESSFGYAGLVATSADLTDYLVALLDRRIVGPDSLAAMQAHSECDCYGLGLAFADTDYGVAVGHSGSDTGVTARVFHYPEVDATLVLLVNAGEDGSMARRIARLWEDAEQVALAGL